MAMWRAVCVLLLLAVATEAAEIQTFNGVGCTGTPTNTFFVAGNTCQTFEDQSSVLISEVTSGTRVSIHNQGFCEMNDQVAQIFGGGCVSQGATPLQAVFIQG